MRVINLSNSYNFVIVDDDKHENFSKFTWWQSRPSKKSKPYVTGYMNKKQDYMHRFILKCKFGIDHINGDSLDNRIENLRECNQSQNNANSKMRRNKKCRYRGVSISNIKNKYRARGCFNKKEYNLGIYDSEEAAAIAYNSWAKNTFGEFARLNNV